MADVGKGGAGQRVAAVPRENGGSGRGAGGVHLQKDRPQELDVLAQAEEVGIHERREAVVRGSLLHGLLNQISPNSAPLHSVRVKGGSTH